MFGSDAFARASGVWF